MDKNRTGTRNKMFVSQKDGYLEELISLCFPIEDRESSVLMQLSGNYLEKGTRIESFAREKGKRQLKCYAGEKGKRFFQIRMKSEERNRYFDYALEKEERRIKKLMEAIRTEEEFRAEARPMLQEVLGLYEEDIQVITEKEDEWQPGYSLCKSSDACMSIKISVSCHGNRLVQFSPVNGKSKKQGFWFFKRSPRVAAYVGPYLEVFACAAVLSGMQEALWELAEDTESRADGLAQKLVYELFDWNYSVGEGIDPEFEACLIAKGYEVDYETLTYRKKGIDKTVDMDFMNSTGMSYIQALYFLYLCLTKKEKIPLEFFLYRQENPKEGEDGIGLYKSGTVHDLLAKLYLILHDEYQEYKAHEEYRRIQNKHIATAYITKKNIPAAIMKEMEQSLFNRCFGYVEYDEDIDIDAVRAAAQEFQKVNLQLFGGVKHKDCAMRIRKLGKHKARGLYYPQLNCLCVDIRSPESFIHEYYHLLDDQLGGLSQKYCFYSVCQKYRELLKKNIQEDVDLGKNLSGSGKYNLEYYLRPEEIFARCGEIYLQRIKKIQSSLLKPDLEEMFAYPESEELEKLICGYYEEFHKKLKKEAC